MENRSANVSPVASSFLGGNGVSPKKDLLKYFIKYETNFRYREGIEELKSRGYIFQPIPRVLFPDQFERSNCF